MYDIPYIEVMVYGRCFMGSYFCTSVAMATPATAKEEEEKTQ